MTNQKSSTRKFGKNHFTAQFYSENKAVLLAQIDQYKALNRPYKVVSAKGVFINGVQAKGKVIFA